ncbi:hypothetical protein Trco_000561 [Trichoderma cornu-damae]|uniref:Uncharacterized protein n=1 Tax=Trichoderma cornu-damae TaxID=654480 RepID=A0A9P8QQI4_9HYPO|nr:hypothetical protein Trco_000561 [Trichoderma cornu-damae]
MPYVGHDVHRATKRKWDHDGNEAFRFSHPVPGAPVFHVLSQQAAPENAGSVSARKTLPPAKRFRTIHDNGAHGHDDIHRSSHRRNASRELAATTTQGVRANDTSRSPVKINGMALMPCHICHRRPTKKSDIDSFARCQSCQEQTCFVCIRECRGRHDGGEASAPLPSDDDEGLSRSFHMDDADECTTPPMIPNHPSAQQYNGDVNAPEGTAGRRTASRSIHRAMICSRCCVEKGAEGEVVCLGCLSDTDAV